jgi:hypothetical protein
MGTRAESKLHLADRGSFGCLKSMANRNAGKRRAASPLWTRPAGDEGAWQATLTRLIDTHARLKVTLGLVAEEVLLMVPVPEWKRTRLELLLSSAAHEAHHSGQIDYLKGLQAGTPA